MFPKLIQFVIPELRVQTDSFEKLLSGYLTFLEEKEDILTIINKEFSFLHPDIQPEVITTESIARKIFYHQIDSGIRKGEFKKQLNSTKLYYLSIYPQPIET